MEVRGWLAPGCALLAAACSRDAPAGPGGLPPPGTVAISAEPILERPPPRGRVERASVPSCPATGVTEVGYDPRIEIGWAAGVSWSFGYADGDAVLAHL